MEDANPTVESGSDVSYKAKGVGPAFPQTGTPPRVMETSVHKRLCPPGLRAVSFTIDNCPSTAEQIKISVSKYDGSVGCGARGTIHTPLGGGVDIGTVALENNLSNKVNLSMIYVQAIPCLGLRSRIYSRKFIASHPGEHKTRRLETTQMSINQRINK